MEEENKEKIECSGCGCKLEIPKDNAVKGIGTHFIKCEYCGTYTDTGKKEWLELEEGERSSLLSKGASIKSFLIVAISAALISSIAKASGYIVTVGVFILIFFQIILYYVFKSANISKLSEAVRESLKRTEDEKYLALLKEKGITIYPLTKKEKEKYIDYEFIKKELEETEENEENNNSD